MTIFSKEKQAAIAAVAAKYGLPESPDKDKSGVFYDVASGMIIDSRIKSEYFSGLPSVGLYNTATFQIEENTSAICVGIRQAITDAFAKIPKPQPKTHSKSSGWKEPEAPKEEKKDEPKTETKEADPIPEKVKEVKHDEKKTEKAQDVSKTNPKPAEVIIVKCRTCGFEISHQRTLGCMHDDRLPECEGCEEARIKKSKEEVPLKGRDTGKEGKVMNESSKEPEKTKPLTDKELSDKLEAAQANKKPKTALVIGTCEAVAIQYGIPKELANMFFMTLNEGLYIKNPGLLHLAAKKGYGRIEVETTFDEKNQEYESTCKVFPKITRELMEGISHLAPEMQKTAWDYATAPTNGTGRASAKSVKMSTMQPFLKEMSQTRAQNRALRAYTGYGGTSLEELPEAEVKYIEG